MDLLVLSLSQEVSFEDSSITNFVIVRAPSGHVIRGIITDESARILVENLATQKVGGPLPARPSVSAPSNQASPMPSSPHGDGPVVFGGDPENGGDPDEHAPWLPGAGDPPPPSSFVPPEAPPPAYQDVDSQTRDYRNKQRSQAESMKRGGSLNAKSVPKDDAGYPITGGAGADPGEIMGGGAFGADEDGVGQV